MSKLFKRLLALMLVLTMVFSLAACDSGSGSSKKSNKSSSSKDKDEDENESTDGGSDNGGSNGGSSVPSGTQMEKATQLSDPNLRYVMVYNPKGYDENMRTQTSTMTVGSFGTQIDVDASRGDGLETEKPQYTSISQLDWMNMLPENMELETDRANTMGVDYQLGDTKDFYYISTINDDISARRSAIFTCQYVGQYCYIWTMNASISQTEITGLGQEFDTKIYKNVTDTFGTPRFVGETGKVNIVLNGMSGGLMGAFVLPDLFTTAELPSAGLSGWTCNTGHAIINVNANLLNATYREDAYSTTAHELQHLVNFSAFFETAAGATMNTWLNEGFSGYIEEVLYTGAKESTGHYDSYNDSELIRNGQSLYNFTINSYDVGVYGSVYYFAKYLEKIAGNSIFSSIMRYWRDSYSSTLNTAEALAKSVSANVYNQISQTIDYTPLNIRFSSSYEEWMSKLCLNFYLSTLSNNYNIADFQNIDRNAILYDNMDGTTVEGGGRIILALSGTTFDIPSDSDSGLIYIGLDENFKPITGFVYQ